jgi:hypothetical protein
MQLLHCKADPGLAISGGWLLLLMWPARTSAHLLLLSLFLHYIMSITRCCTST